MADNCLPQVHACAIRVTALESDGILAPGTDTMYVSDALTRLTLKPVYEDASEIKEKNACDAVAVNYKGDDSFLRADVELELLTVDPYLNSLLATGSVLLNSSNGPGWAMPAIGVNVGNGVSIELWAKRINDGDLDPDMPYAWWSMPKVKSLRVGDREFSATAQKPLFTGQAVENSNWFDGPDNMWDVASDRCAQWIPTDTLPTPTCGFVELEAS